MRAAGCGVRAWSLGGFGVDEGVFIGEVSFASQSLMCMSFLCVARMDMI